jgi:hypothetical protein
MRSTRHGLRLSAARSGSSSSGKAAGENLDRKAQAGEGRDRVARPIRSGRRPIRLAQPPQIDLRRRGHVQGPCSRDSRRTCGACARSTCPHGVSCSPERFIASLSRAGSSVRHYRLTNNRLTNNAVPICRHTALESHNAMPECGSWAYATFPAVDWLAPMLKSFEPCDGSKFS